MFWNNVKIALRNLHKHKGFAAINITGLAIGLTIYVFGGLLVDYERTHDLFFENADRIYTIGATAAPELNVGVSKFNAVQSAVGPAIEANIPDVEAVARTLANEYLVQRARTVSTRRYGFRTRPCWTSSISTISMAIAAHWAARRRC